MKVRLRIADQEIFCYPDLMLSCDSSDRETYYSSKPCIIECLGIELGVDAMYEKVERLA